jgi:hypothetical protein
LSGSRRESSSEFFEDPTKERQSNAWLDAASVLDKPEAINHLIQNSGVETNLISDGYHTFGELYEHRTTNFLVLCRTKVMLNYSDNYIADYKGLAPVSHNVWRSKNHSDGEPAFGGTWFVLGIGIKPGKQITYHLPIEAWDKTSFADTLEQAPEWDGHTSADVLERLANL